MNTLPDDNISNDTLWTYKENIEIFNKYNQLIIQNIHQNLNDKNKNIYIPSNTEIKIDNKLKYDINHEINDTNKKIENIKKEIIEPVINKQQEINKQEIKKHVKNTKTKVESPIDLIIRLTYVDKIMKNDIKDKLIEFISLPEFSKVFGLKKSSEIMTALSKDSWNQSISLFISFLLDKNIIYKDKSYIYNKDKSNQIITVS